MAIDPAVVSRMPADFRINRAMVEWVGISTIVGHIVTAGRYTVIQEDMFGGYQYHVRYKERFWDWNSSYWLFTDIFEDIYITPPGSSTPIPSGSGIGTSTGWLPGYLHPMVFVDNVFFGQVTFSFVALPPAPDDWWNKNGIPNPDMPFSTTFTP